MFVSCLQGSVGAPGPPGDRGVVGIGVCLVFIWINLKKYIGRLISIDFTCIYRVLQASLVWVELEVTLEKRYFSYPLRLLKLFLNTDYVILNYLIHDVQNEF